MTEKTGGIQLEQALLSKHGGDLIKAIAANFQMLESKIEALELKLRNFETYARQAEIAVMLKAAGEPGDAVALTSVNVSAIEYLQSSDNFYELEYTDSGVAYRWTGPDRSFGFTLMLDRRKPLHLELVLVNFVDRALQTPLLLKVDGETVELAPVATPAREIRFAAKLPARTGNFQVATEIVFFVRQTLKAGAGDTRQLGAAFSEIKIRPADGEQAGAGAR